MKKEIMKLVNSPDGQLRINNVCTLRRWTRDGVGQTVDCLKLTFDTINGVEFSGWTAINSRDYDGIIDEISQATEAFFASVAETLVKELKNGYSNVSRKGENNEQH